MRNAECFKWVKIVNFVMCEFYHDKKKIRVLLKRNRMQMNIGVDTQWSCYAWFFNCNHLIVSGISGSCAHLVVRGRGL